MSFSVGPRLPLDLSQYPYGHIQIDTLSSNLIVGLCHEHGLLPKHCD